MEIRNLLVIEPHPDDLILMCGGLVKKLTLENIPVHVITLTNGGAYTADEKAGKLQRAEETRIADEILGIRGENREILNFKPRACWSRHEELYNTLLEKIRKIHPDTVITTQSDRLHPDHMWIAEFAPPLIYQARENIRPDLGAPVKTRLLFGENPRRQLVVPAEELIYEDITKTFEYKKIALLNQTSQLPVLGKDIAIKAERLAIGRATTQDAGVKYCEAFEEIKIPG